MGRFFKKVSLLFLALLPLTLGGGVQGREPLKVVASFTILADIAKIVGGEHVAVDFIVGFNGDAHTFEPNPRGAQTILKADLILINGLGFEGWITRLIEATQTKAPVVCMTDGMPILTDPRDHKTPDPHAWSSPKRGLYYVDAVERAFSAADPDHARDFQKNAAGLKHQLKRLDDWFSKTVKDVPPEKRIIITSHDAFNYLCADYGISPYSLFGIDTNSQPSAKQVAALIQLIRSRDVKGLLVENITNRALMEQIAEETHVAVLEKVYSDALCGSGEGPATSYVNLLAHNLRVIVSSWAP